MGGSFRISQNQLVGVLDNELPGNGAHLSMLPSGRPLNAENLASEIKQSAVLLLIVDSGIELFLCLTLRNTKLKHHPGQISFPGGRCEANEPDASLTALRETEEEIGVCKSDIKVLGKLSELYVQASNFNIHPFIGWVNGVPSFKLHSPEVDEVIMLPFSSIFDPITKQEHVVETSSGPLLVPCYYFEGKIIWGATAMIIAELECLLRKYFHRRAKGYDSAGSTP